MGSASDLPLAKDALRVLTEFGVSYTARVLSAHRTPEQAAAAARLQALLAWRRQQVEARHCPAYLVLGNRTLEALARLAPHTVEELDAVPGMGPATIARYGRELLARLHTP